MPRTRLSSMPSMTLQERIESSLSRSEAKVFLRKEFDRFGGYDQVGRALRGIIAKGLLVKAGYGIYVKAKKSSITGNPVPVAPLIEVGAAALAKLGGQAQPSSAAATYMAGRSTQMPMGDALCVGSSRVRRKIGFASKTVRFER
ncbi:conserved hypothetical protein [Verminephrobacter eiseniae EF01-2]|uniref:S-adenosylhomocysteine hydrolase n=2 Tax=Verminephrobacter eiseniae TaxID=364317 RepID=A1WP49_VEREI|nr:conserved hypothetical protein [Verminephrobacter eiseniae EF01-2]